MSAVGPVTAGELVYYLLNNNIQYIAAPDSFANNNWSWITNITIKGNCAILNQGVALSGEDAMSAIEFRRILEKLPKNYLVVLSLDSDFFVFTAYQYYNEMGGLNLYLGSPKSYMQRYAWAMKNYL